MNRNDEAALIMLRQYLNMEQHEWAMEAEQEKMDDEEDDDGQWMSHEMDIVGSAYKREEIMNLLHKWNAGEDIVMARLAAE